MAFDAIEVIRAPRELVAVGGLLDVPTLRSAYRHGVFPWPASLEDARAHDRSLRRIKDVPRLPGTPPDGHLVPWVSPHPRAVLLVDRLSVPRTVRQLLRRTGWEATVDAAFDEVLERCADRRGEGTWITPAMREGYRALHEAGIAHSVEVWDGSRLVGGLYGVQSGGVFSGESMFFVESGASKVAVVELCRRMAEAGMPLLDTQQESPHLAAMGQVLAGRADYVEAVLRLRDLPCVLRTDRLSVGR